MRSSLATVPLLPIALAQALWVILRAERLPEPAGNRSGTEGSGPPLRVLIAGDSSAAGVGVTHQSDALAGQLAQRLAARFSVEWHLVARSGATTAETLEALRSFRGGPFDIALTALGVNDAKNGVPLRSWLASYESLLALLQTRFGVQQTYVSGFPPVGHFPLLPNPLRKLLGSRAERFDQALCELLIRKPDSRYISLQFPMDAARMASDGFHPGPTIYAEWADRTSHAVLRDRSHNVT